MNGCIGVLIDLHPTLAARNKNAARMGHPDFHYTISESALAPSSRIIRAIALYTDV
jgi:hypothetical protein